MASTKAAREICRAFIAGEKPAMRSATVRTGESAVFSYGDHWPMLVRGRDDLDGAYLLNAGKVSQTTTAHTGAAAAALRAAGYRDTGELVKDFPKPKYFGYSTGTHAFAVWRKPA